MALLQTLAEDIGYIGRVATGASKTVGVAKHIKQRAAQGKLFDFFGSGVPFSTVGKVMVAGWGIQSAMSSAYEGYAESKLGTPTGQTLSATPQPNYTRFGGTYQNNPNSSIMQEQARALSETSYYNSAVEMGATGNLVFAMNQNRRG